MSLCWGSSENKLFSKYKNSQINRKLEQIYSIFSMKVEDIGLCLFQSECVVVHFWAHFPNLIETTKLDILLADSNGFEHNRALSLQWP